MVESVMNSDDDFSFDVQKRPEDHPARKKQDLKLALIAGITVIVVIALVITAWVYWI